ncbi:MAG: cbb3-type cytochrome c oxidase N-terminal domain-containing protein [Verrucomicrobiota bacterium]
MKPSDSQKNEIILKEHVYDGIQEYDQKLPNWWLFTLYITIVWFVFAWVAYYQLPFDMADDHEKIETQMAMIESKKQEELETMMASISNESLQEMSGETSHVDSGKAIYEAKCVACHGQDLSATMGGIQLPGVALNDDEWLYGAEPLNIMEIVTNGSPDVTKGMIAWNTQLSPAEIAQVVAYILSQQSS